MRRRRLRPLREYLGRLDLALIVSGTSDKPPHYGTGMVMCGSGVGYQEDIGARGFCLVFCA